MKKVNTGLVGRNANAIGRIKALLHPRGAPTGLGLVFILSMFQELSRADELEEAHVLLDQTTLDQIVETLQTSYPDLASQLFSDVPLDAQFDAQGATAELADLQTSGYLSESEAQLLANTIKEMESHADSAWADGAYDTSQDIQLAQADTGAASVGSQAAVVAGGAEAATAVPAAGALGAGLAPSAMIGALSFVGVGIAASNSGSGHAATATTATTATTAAPAAVSLSGKLADGYIRGAQIYIDANGDGIAQNSEILVGVTTDAFGNFTLPAGVSGAIIAVGGFNIDTGIANVINMRAPAGATMLTPLTTLVSGYMQAHPGATAAFANSAILTALGLPAGVDLASYDPLAALATNPNDAAALAIQKSAAMVATIVQMAAASPTGVLSATDAAATVMAKLLAAVTAGPVDLASGALIESALNGVSTASVADVLAATSAIDIAIDLGHISSAQSNAMDHTAPEAQTLALEAGSDSGTSDTDGITNVLNPTVRVSFDVTVTDGSAAVVGNTVGIFVGEETLVSVVLTQADITNGYVDITLTGLTPNATSVLTANMIDAVGHTSLMSSGLSVTIDTLAPEAPFIAAVRALDGDTVVGGTAVAGDVVDVSWGSTVHHVTAGQEGTWETTFSSAETTGTTSISATVTDTAGNTSDHAFGISDADAAAMVADGIHFAETDHVMLGQAQGTHLQTNLHDLQMLGVDVVNVSGGQVGEFVIAAGAGAIDFAHLPTVSGAAGSSVQVGLGVTDATFADMSAAQVTDAATQLRLHGFDNITAADASNSSLHMTSALIQDLHAGGLSFVTGVADGAQDTAIANVVTAIDDEENYAHNLDVLDLGGNAVNLTEAQAASLVSAGIHFAADDTGVVVHAEGTHLSTSLHDLQALGVDFVHADATDATHTIVLDMGVGGSANGVLPVFDEQDHVQLNVMDSQLSSLIDLIHMNGTNPNIDVVSVVLNDSIGAPLGGLGVPYEDLHNAGTTVELDAAYAASAVSLGMILQAANGEADPLALMHGQTLADALAAAGISDIKIDQVTHFSVDDTDLKPLMDAGLIKADAGADVTVNHAGSGTLDVTLAQLAGIGADHVVQTGDLVVNAGVSFTNLGDLEAKLNDLLTKFEDSNGVVDKQLFENASAVDLHVSGTLATEETLSPELVAKLTLLGIDDVHNDQDLSGHSLK